MDANGIIAQLEGDPALRAQLRAVLLGDEVLQLPAIVRELAGQVEALAEAQSRTESRLEQLAGQVEALAEAQSRTESRLEQLAGQVEALASRLEQLAGQVEALAEAQSRTGLQLQRLVTWSDASDSDVARLKGMLLEHRVERAPRRYISRRLATSVRSIDPARLDDLLGRLEPASAEDVDLADAFVEGVSLRGEPLLFVVEVSWKAHSDDVHRAARRAEALREVVPAAVGLVVSQQEPGDAVVAAARALGVALVSESGGVLVGLADAA